MNKRFGFAALLLLALPLMAHASCDDVKSSIDAKIKAKGVTNYSLDVVSGDQAGNGGKVVGQCEGDKKIVYTRGGGNGDAASGDSSNASGDDAAAKPKHHHHPKKADDAGKAEDASKPASASTSGG